MAAGADTATLEAVLGYTFAKPGLLVSALCHSSWSNEHPGSPEGDNERLEFLGDAVLDLVIGHLLMERFPEKREGDLSVTRAQVVSEAGLAEAAAGIGLGNWIRLGKGEEKSGGRQKASILADAFEAVIAAVFLDGGYAAAAALVRRVLAGRIENFEEKGHYDLKTRLQEFCQAQLKLTPNYRVLAELGPDHDKRFVVAAVLNDREWGRAAGKSKKEAEQLAAAEAYFCLHLLGPDELIEKVGVVEHAEADADEPR